MRPVVRGRASPVYLCSPTGQFFDVIRLLLDIYFPEFDNETSESVISPPMLMGKPSGSNSIRRTAKNGR